MTPGGKRVSDVTRGGGGGGTRPSDVIRGIPLCIDGEVRQNEYILNVLVFRNIN